MFLTLIFWALFIAATIYSPLARNVIMSRCRLALFYLATLKAVGTDTPPLPTDPPPPQNLLAENGPVTSSPASPTEPTAAEAAASSSSTVAPPSPKKKKSKAEQFHPAGTRVRITMVRHGESVGNVVAKRADEFKEKKDFPSALALAQAIYPAVVCEVEMLLTQMHGGSYSDWPLTHDGENQAMQLRSLIEGGSVSGFPNWMKENGEAPPGHSSNGADTPATGASTPANSEPTTPRSSPRRTRSPAGSSPRRDKEGRDLFAGKERVIMVSSQLKRAAKTLQLALNPVRNAQLTGGALVDSALQETCPHFDSSSPLSHRPNPQLPLSSEILFNWRVGYGRSDGVNLHGFNRYRTYANKAVAALDDASLAKEQQYSADSLWRRMDCFVASVFARSTAPELLPYCSMISANERRSRHKRRTSFARVYSGDVDEDLAASGIKEEPPVDRVCLVGHGSWIRRFFTRYLPAQEAISRDDNERARDLAMTLRTKGLSNTATVEFDLVLGTDGVPRIDPETLALHRGELRTLNLVSPATNVGAGVAFSAPASPGGPVSSSSGKEITKADIPSDLRERLVALYTKYEPAKAEKVDYFLKKYETEPHVLASQLVTKYGAQHGENAVREMLIGKSSGTTSAAAAAVPAAAVPAPEPVVQKKQDYPQPVAASAAAPQPAAVAAAVATTTSAAEPEKNDAPKPGKECDESLL